MDMETYSLLLDHLGCPAKTYQLFDFYHVTEHLQIFADVVFNEEKEQKTWFQKSKKVLKRGKALTLIQEMDKFIASAAAEHSQTLIKQRDYLLRAYREKRLNYAKVSDHKLPIGSGEERKFNPPSCQFKNERKQ